MAYDASDRYVLLFGGLTNAQSNGANDTWTFQNGSWTNLTSSLHVAPPTGYANAMAYDGADGYVLLLVGNVTAITHPTESWEFHNGAWSQIFPTTEPPVWSRGDLTYDAADGYIVLFGGVVGATPEGYYTNATWTYLNGTWTNISASVGSSPSPRGSSGFAYDPADGYLVLFGGWGTSGWTLNDTWTYLAGHWRNISGSVAPTPRAEPGFAFDSTDGYLVLDGGYGGITGTAAGDTWTFIGGNWTEIWPGGHNPGRRDAPAMADDPLAGYVVLFGGEWPPVTNGTTFAYSAGNWTDMTPVPIERVPGFLAGMVFDGKDNYTLLFEPSYLDTNGLTWTFAGGNWTQLHLPYAPSSRILADMTYDAADGYVVLYGGQNSTGGTSPFPILTDTWTYAGGRWTDLNLTASASPTGQPFSAFAYDSNDSEGVLLTNSVYGWWVTPTIQTWTFRAGTWTQANVSSEPPGQAVGSLVDDVATGYVLYFGGYSATGSGSGCNAPTGPCGTTWKFAAGVWTNLTATLSSAPPARWAASMAYDAADQKVLLFGGFTTTWNGTFDRLLNDTWVFGSSGWAQVTSGPAPSARYAASMAYDALDGSVVLFGGSRANTSVGWDYEYANASIIPDTWWFSNGSWSQSSPALAPTLSALDVGRTTVLRVETGGLLVATNYTYSGLPAGCVGTNVSSLSCSPIVAGSFLVTVAVGLESGTEATAQTQLTVNPAPSVSAFSASPSVIRLGESTELGVVAVGGTGPLEVSYTGLPVGCVPLDLSRLPCSPTAAGTYDVHATITDSEAEAATAILTLRVLPAIAPGPSLPSVPGHLGRGPGTPGSPQSPVAQFVAIPYAGLATAFGVAALATIGLLEWRAARIRSEAQELLRRLRRDSPTEPDRGRSERTDLGGGSGGNA